MVKVYTGDDIPLAWSSALISRLSAANRTARETTRSRSFRPGSASTRPHPSPRLFNPYAGKPSAGLAAAPCASIICRNLFVFPREHGVCADGLGTRDTRSRVADKIRMHRNYNGQIERGEINLTLKSLETVCKGLGVRMSEVLKNACD